MKTLILSYNDGVYISGSYISVVDLFFNLREIRDIEMVTMIDLDSISIMRYFKLHKFFGDARITSGLTRERNFESDIIIMSCELLAILAEGNAGVRQIPIRANIKCDKLILLDSFDLQRFKDNPPSIRNNIDCQECIVLGNPANRDILPVKYYEYYHKFSPIRLESLSVPKEPFDYCRSAKQHIKLSGDHFFENIGKSIFENILKGNDVNYNPNGLKGRDGLYYYLKLFNVDPSVEHNPLKISRGDVMEKLFFKKTDQILEVL